MTQQDTDRNLTHTDTIAALIAYCRAHDLVHDPRETDDPVYLLTRAAGDAVLCQNSEGTITVSEGPWAGVYTGAPAPQLPRIRWPGDCS